MFRKIWKWTKGESILAEAIGVVANRATGGLLGADRNLRDVIDKVRQGESFF